MKAYELRVEADKAREQGNISQAADLLRQAAELDATYSVLAELIDSQTPFQRPRVESTVRRLLVPHLAALGFEVPSDGPWKEGQMLTRQRPRGQESVYISRTKSGGMLRLLASRTVGDDVTYFDTKQIDIRSGALAYRSQEELESVCTRWREIVTRHIVPWFDGATDARVIDMRIL